MRFRTLIKRSLVGLCFFLLFTFTLEVILRVFHLVHTRVVNESIYPGLLGDYKPLQDLSSDLIFPHHIKINSQGLRGQEININKQKGSFRIVILGDSFTFGSRVNDAETFPFQLETLSEGGRKAGKRIEVINAGHDAYSTREEYEYFMERGAHLHPDMLILAWFPNDIMELSRTDSWRNLLKKHYKFEPFKSYMRSLAVFNALRINVSYAFIKFKMGSYVSKEIIDIFDTKDTALEQKLWSNCFAYILKLKQFCDKGKIKFLLVALPDFKQFSLNDEFRPQGRLKIFTDVNQISFLDLSDRFKSFARGKDINELYLYPKDCHFSALGNYLVAKELFDYMNLTFTKRCVKADSQEKNKIID